MGNHKILFLSIFKKRESCKINMSNNSHDWKQSMKDIGEQIDDLESPRKRIPWKMCLTPWISLFTRISVLKSNGVIRLCEDSREASAAVIYHIPTLDKTIYNVNERLQLIEP